MTGTPLLPPHFAQGFSARGFVAGISSKDGIMKKRRSAGNTMEEALQRSKSVPVVAMASLLALLSWSGASQDRPRKSKRTRLTHQLSAALCQSLRKPSAQASLVIALLPALGTAMPMELATLSASATSTSMTGFAMLGTMAWYGLAGTGVWYGLEAVELAKNGVEDLIIEGVEGARIVVQCFWYGVLIFTALVLARAGRAILDYVTERIEDRRSSRSSLDLHELRYGRRLPGGSREGSPGGRSGRLSRTPQERELDIDLLFGDRPDQTKAIEYDMQRLWADCIFSFVYAGGNRIGVRRTVKLVRDRRYPW